MPNAAHPFGSPGPAPRTPVAEAYSSASRRNAASSSSTSTTSRSHVGSAAFDQGSPRAFYLNRQTLTVYSDPRAEYKEMGRGESVVQAKTWEAVASMIEDIEAEQDEGDIVME